MREKDLCKSVSIRGREISFERVHLWALLIPTNCTDNHELLMWTVDKIYQDNQGNLWFEKEN